MQLTPQHRLAALNGYEEITVKKLDGAELKVRVAIVPIRHLGTFVDTFDKPAELAEFICHVDGAPVPEFWADGLTDESVYAIREKAKELNFQRAVTWTEQQIAAGTGVMMPLIEKFLIFQKSVHGHASQSD